MPTSPQRQQQTTEIHNWSKIDLKSPTRLPEELFKKDIPDFKIDGEGARKLLDIAMDGDAITPKELDAMLLLINKDAFANDAKVALEKAFAYDAVIRTLGNGTGVLLKSDKDLRLVYNALALAATTVDFFNPEAGISYNAHQYEAMKVLIRDGDIPVLSVKDHGLVAKQNKGAEFLDRKLYFFEGFTVTADVIAHEMTHGIQHYLHLKGTTGSLELDGYIAQAMCQSKLGTYGNGPLKGDLFDMAIQKKATASNGEYVRLYTKEAKKVGEAYAGNFNTATNRDTTTGFSQKQQDEESKKLNDILTKLGKKK